MKKDEKLSLYGLKAEKIIYSHRKSVALSISNSGQLIVRAPYGLPYHKIEGIISRKSRWIAKHKREAALRQQKLSRFINDKRLLFLGQPYPFLISDDETHNRVTLSEGRIVIGTKKETDPLPVLIRWYGQTGMRIVMPAITEYCSLLNVCCDKVALSKAKRRWGSCNNRLKRINLSWRLFMAPPDVIEYVVLHELVHLIEPNHGRMFWKRIAAIMPDYKEKSNWLKENEYRMQIDSLFS